MHCTSHSPPKRPMARRVHAADLCNSFIEWRSVQLGYGCFRLNLLMMRPYNWSPGRGAGGPSQWSISHIIWGDRDWLGVLRRLRLLA